MWLRGRQTPWRFHLLRSNGNFSISGTQSSPAAGRFPLERTGSVPCNSWSRFITPAGRDRLSRSVPKIRVPGSSANLGPGFDALGLALGIYLPCRFEVSQELSI